MHGSWDAKAPDYTYSDAERARRHSDLRGETPQMTITNSSEARLFKLRDGDPQEPGLKLTKTKERTQNEPRQ